MQIELCLFSPFNLPVLDKSIRIELCSDFFQGGLSPSTSSFSKCRGIYTNQIFVMIRPRGGDFCYSSDEFEFLKEELKWFKENGADGIVLGILNTDGSVDVQRTSELVQLAYPLPVTFHRAFDMSNNLNKSLEDVIESGCSRILSSGGESNVSMGYTRLVELKEQASSRIDIMPGGGVTIDNVQEFINAGFKNIHLSAKKFQQSSMKFRANLSMTSHSSISSFDYIGVDFNKLKEFTNYVRKNETL